MERKTPEFRQPNGHIYLHSPALRTGRWKWTRPSQSRILLLTTEASKRVKGRNNFEMAVLRETRASATDFVLARIVSRVERLLLQILFRVNFVSFKLQLRY